MAHFEELEAFFCGWQRNTIQYLSDLYSEPEKWQGHEDSQGRGN
jgi:hypothetical protein